MAPTTTVAITPRIIGTSRLRREGPARPAPPAPTSVTARWVRRQKRGGTRVSADSPEGRPPRRGGGATARDGREGASSTPRALASGRGPRSRSGRPRRSRCSRSSSLRMSVRPRSPPWRGRGWPGSPPSCRSGPGSRSGSPRHRLGLGQGVVRLPAEVVGRDRQEDLARTVGVGRLVLEALAPQVHVGHEAEHVGVGREPERRGDRMVGGAGGIRNRCWAIPSVYARRVTGALAKIRPTFERSVRIVPVGV